MQEDYSQYSQQQSQTYMAPYQYQEQYGNQTQYVQEVQQMKLLTFQELPINVINEQSLPGVAQQIEQQFEQGRRAWQANFEAITYLRIINKQFPTSVNQLFEKFGIQLLGFIDEVKPYILRNTIYLITEVMKNGRQVPLHENIIKMFVPKIALKSQTSESKLIKEDCLVCMSEFVINCLCDQSVIVVCDLCSEKNKQVQLQLFGLRMLAKLLENINTNIKLLKQETLQYLVLTLSCSVDSRRLDSQNFGYQICMYLYNLLGQDVFLNLVGAFLNPTQKNDMIKILQQKNEKESRKHDIKQSERKSLIKKNKENQGQQQYPFCPQYCVQTPQKLEYWVDGNQLNLNNNMMQ